MNLNQPQVALNQTKPVTCDNCEGLYMIQALHIRKASGLLTGAKEASYMPIPVFQCSECHHVNTEFLPVEVRAELNDSE